VTLWVILSAAALLSVERITYLWIWYKPEAFRCFCNRQWAKSLGGPVDVLKYPFYAFKLLQGAVFVGWCYFFSRGEIFPIGGNVLSVALGVLVMALGQLLNVGVFYRLGKVGVFYGGKFGYRVSWCREFPFTVCSHPQYAGALLSIWGFFLLMRFPHVDWYWLPVLETI